MSAQRWQSWMALLPCDRCGWMPGYGCTCTGSVRTPTAFVPRPARSLRILTLDERRAAYSSISEAITEVVAEQKNERQEGAA